MFVVVVFEQCVDVCYGVFVMFVCVQVYWCFQCEIFVWVVDEDWQDWYVCGLCDVQKVVFLVCYLFVCVFGCDVQLYVFMLGEVCGYLLYDVGGGVVIDWNQFEWMQDDVEWVGQYFVFDYD